MSVEESHSEAETRAYLLSELEDMGAPVLIGGLEAILMEADGQIVSEGVTQDMRDGSAAVAVASADIVAIVLGHPRAGEDAAFLAALEPYAEELREETGLANLAERALAIVANPERAEYAAAKGTEESPAAFQAVLTEVRARVALAEADHPGEWDMMAVPEGAFQVTMFAEDGDG
ncbi:MAG: hypothetical protein AAFY59_03475 [Pseudomonadota bacterium]